MTVAAPVGPAAPGPAARREEVRAAIRRAAVEEFAARGLDGASTQGIARRAGISKAQLHYYIDSKAELYEETLVALLDRWSDIFFLSIRSGGPREAIAAYIAAKLHHAIEHPAESRLFAQEVLRGAPVLRAHWGRAREAAGEAAAVIARWVDEGAMAPVDPWLFQMQIWAVTQHFADYEAQVRFFLEVPEGAPLDEARIAAEITRTFLRGAGLTSA